MHQHLLLTNKYFLYLVIHTFTEQLIILFCMLIVHYKDFSSIKFAISLFIKKTESVVKFNNA